MEHEKKQSKKPSKASFGSLESILGGDGEDDSKGDEAEKIQRMRAAGIEPCPPNRAMQYLVEMFPSTENDREGAHQKAARILQVLAEKTEAELRQLHYWAKAAEVGASNLHSAIASVGLLKATGSEEDLRRFIEEVRNCS